VTRERGQARRSPLHARYLQLWLVVIIAMLGKRRDVVNLRRHTATADATVTDLRAPTLRLARRIGKGLSLDGR